MFNAVLFTLAKIREQPKCLVNVWMDKENVLYVCVCVCVCVVIQQNIIQPYKEGNYTICIDMNKCPEVHYAKSSKWDTEGSILCDLIYVWNEKKVKVKEVASKMVDAKGWRGREGNGEMLGYKCPVIKWTSSRDLMYNTVTIVNKNSQYNVLYTWSLLRVDLKWSYDTIKEDDHMKCWIC